MINKIMATFIITTQPQSASLVNGQDVTLSVGVSADYSPATYLYQWRKNSLPITGATSQTYFQTAPTSGTYSVAVSALSASSFISSLTSSNAVLTVSEDVSPFDVYDVGAETGRERHKRLRHLGYV